MMKYYLLILLAVLVPVAALAENVKISGKVVDAEDKPVEFATVRVASFFRIFVVKSSSTVQP